MNYGKIIARGNYMVSSSIISMIFPSKNAQCNELQNVHRDVVACALVSFSFLLEFEIQLASMSKQQIFSSLFRK